MAAFLYVTLFLNLILARNAQAFNIFKENAYTPQNLENVSSLCRQQYNASDFDTLLQMFDASAKIPEGIGSLRFYHLGDFDECYNLQTKTDIGPLYGKYCLGTLPLTTAMSQNKLLHEKFDVKRIPYSPFAPATLGTNQESVGFHIGYCVPSGCSAEDLQTMTLEILKFDEMFCHSKDTEPELSGGAIAAITVISIFIGFVVVSTCLDIALYYLQKKAPHELLLAFSAFTNGKKLISASRSADQLNCLNGIRAISMMWVLAAHVYLNAMNGPVASFAKAFSFMDATENMFIVGGSVSVDTFFVVGGLVTVYTFLKAAEKGVKFNIIMYYIHRYLRLTPALAVIVLIHCTLIDYMGSGPLWNNLHDDFVETCNKYWWTALLYIQNFVHGSDTCVPQSWYLSVDFQLFLLSPLVLLPLKKKPKLGIALLSVLIVLGIITPFVIAYVYKIPASMMMQSGTTSNASDQLDMMWIYYKQTHTRFGPYVIGMLVGYYIYKLKKNKTKIVIHPILSFGVWIVSVGGLVACVYCNHELADYDRLGHSFAIAFLRNGWAVCVCGVAFMCIFGYGGIVDWFLSLPIFQFITKLSYSMYLIHYALISIRYSSQKYIFDFSNSYLLWSFWGDFMFTLALSAVLCLTFESPIIVLEKHIFRPRSRKQ